MGGKTGWLVEPTAEAWAEALPAVADRETNEGLGEAARKRTIERHSPAVYQERLMEIYEQYRDGTVRGGLLD